MSGTLRRRSRVDGIMVRLAAMLMFGLLAVDAAAGGARAADDSPYSIMKPEPRTPGVVDPYRSPRRTPQRPARVPRSPSPQQRHVAPPPPIVVPQTGQVVPSQPILPRGAVPGGGAESFGDRAARCAHQAGLAGLPADQRGSYMGSCLNQ